MTDYRESSGNFCCICHGRQVYRKAIGYSGRIHGVIIDFAVGKPDEYPYKNDPYVECFYGLLQ